MIANRIWILEIRFLEDVLNSNSELSEIREYLEMSSWKTSWYLTAVYDHSLPQSSNQLLTKIQWSVTYKLTHAENKSKQKIRTKYNDVNSFEILLGTSLSSMSC